MADHPPAGRAIGLDGPPPPVVHVADVSRSARLPKGRVFVVPRGAEGGYGDRSTTVAEAVAAAASSAPDGGGCMTVARVGGGGGDTTVRLAGPAALGAPAARWPNAANRRTALSGSLGHGTRVTKVPSITSAAAVAIHTMARIASSRSMHGGVGGGGGRSSMDDVKSMSAAYERVILKMAAGGGGGGAAAAAGARAGGVVRDGADEVNTAMVHGGDTNLSLMTSASDVDVVNAAVQLARSRQLPRRGRGGGGAAGAPTSRRARFLDIIIPSRRRAALAARRTQLIEVGGAGTRGRQATGNGGGERRRVGAAGIASAAALPAAAEPSSAATAAAIVAAAAVASERIRAAAAAAEWVVGLEATPSDVLVVPSADVDVDLDGRYPVSAVSSASSASLQTSPNATTAGVGGGGVVKPPPYAPSSSTSSTSSTLTRSTATYGRAATAATPKPPATPTGVAAKLPPASGVRRLFSDAPSAGRGGGATHGRGDGGGGGGGGGGVAPAGTRSPGGTLRSAPPVVAALAAAAPQKFGLRPSENSVDGFNGNVSYAPDEFVAFIDPHGKARQPRLPWVARWVPKLHPPEAPHPTADADRESEEEEEDGETDLDQPSMAASKSRPSPGVGVRWGFARHTARAAADEEGDTDEWENEWGSVRDALPVERARPPAITPSPSGAKPRSLRKVAQALGLPVRQRHAAGAV
ncbi:hypothetical protein BU14_0251s0003 [Porphyra umbilicalis]|uniref:Uncharacterized protein n=1 Tax=Porphyra umbilicalis TaxID=2786 RepID=A0A1X6P2N7_PORUM|nr:hypothetical protein BU14_0251s0003 [Porphyra umbilicalis]|eukprot:OSX75162.1 hypothetical protein BU14_0251s0003 [Porphyra umbilicalis]